MESEEIKTALRKAADSPNGWQSVRHLILKLKKEDPEIVLEALLEIFFLENHYGHQLAAGGILWKLKLKYKRNLREDMKRSLPTWNVSVRELPWYLAEVKGITTVIEEAGSILTEPISELERKKLETYLYWLKVRDVAEHKIQLNQRWNGRL